MSDVTPPQADLLPAELVDRLSQLRQRLDELRGRL